MNGYISYTEVQSAVTERLEQRKRQRIILNPRGRQRVRVLAAALLSFLF